MRVAADEAAGEMTKVTRVAREGRVREELLTPDRRKEILRKERSG